MKQEEGLTVQLSFVCFNDLDNKYSMAIEFVCWGKELCKILSFFNRVLTFLSGTLVLLIFLFFK